MQALSSNNSALSRNEKTNFCSGFLPAGFSQILPVFSSYLGSGRQAAISVMKIFNWVFVILFVLFAAVQYNDPDPYVWMPIYLYAAVLCWLASRRRFNKVAYLAGFAVYIPYAVYKAFDENGLVDWIRRHHAENIAGTMKAENPWVEETREFFGLVIVISVLAMNYSWLRRRK